MFLRGARAVTRRALRPRGRRRISILIAALIAIPLWQATFRNSKPDPTWRLAASSGLHEEHRFVYFLRHLGLFPVASEVRPSPDTEEGAQRWIETRGDTLVMELGHTIRYGELGKTFLYLPHAIVKGRSERLRVEPAHFLAFTIALLALFAAFWSVRRPLIGAVAVLLFGSNPFQLFEIYGNEEVFSWNITIAVLVLAMHVPLLLGRPRRPYLYALPIATALLLGTIRQVRTEPILIAGSALLTYLTVATWKQRAILIALFLTTFTITSNVWSSWFDSKWLEAQDVISRAGGHPFPGAREKHHLIWHPIWCGLGDFGEDKGYRWDDRAAAAYALPILSTRYQVDVPPYDPTSLVFTDSFLDPDRKYYRVPYLLPHYSDVVRDKVLADISADPLWYVGIILRRFFRVLSDTTPIAIAVRGFAIRLPMHGLLALLIAAALSLGRRRREILLFAFPLPLSATALLIYSGRGVTYYGCFHLLPAAILLAFLIQSVLDRARRLGVRAS